MLVLCHDFKKFSKFPQALLLEFPSLEFRLTNPYWINVAYKTPSADCPWSCIVDRIRQRIRNVKTCKGSSIFLHARPIASVIDKGNFNILFF